MEASEPASFEAPVEGAPVEEPAPEEATPAPSVPALADSVEDGTMFIVDCAVCGRRVESQDLSGFDVRSGCPLGGTECDLHAVSGAGANPSP